MAPLETKMPTEEIVVGRHKEEDGGANLVDITPSTADRSEKGDEVHSKGDYEKTKNEISGLESEHSIEPDQGSTRTLSMSTSSVSIPVLEVDPVHNEAQADPAALGATLAQYKEGKYILPNDLDEQDRLDLQHHLLLVLLDTKLQLAPISPNVQNVLDVGTGTGIWPIEFAIQYPSSSVIGSDLSPIQPDFIPPNCRFEIDDAEDEWTYSTKFDFIHMRGMMTCFSDPKSIMAKAYQALAPGGYLEMQDGVFPMRCHDDTLADTPLDIWGKACVDGAAKTGRPWTNASNYKTWMEELGFVDIKEKIFEVPTSTWPKGNKAKELGVWFGADLVGAVGATKAIFTRVLGWDPEKVELFFLDVKKCISNRRVHAWMPIHVVYGRKP